MLGLTFCVTEYYGVMVCSPALYSGCASTKFWSGERLYGLKLCMVTPFPQEKSRHSALNYVKISSFHGPGSVVGLDGPGIESRWRARYFGTPQTVPGVHPASYAKGTSVFLCPVIG